MPFPARIHVLLASGSSIGLVIRRGPANAVCTLLWDRTTGEIRLGQWMRARLYERRSDLSPDGRHLIYFARNSRWASETRGTWTAISRAPWLKAVVLYGKGNTWGGGGLFTSNRKYWLNGCDHFLIRDSREVERDDTYVPAGCYGAECHSVYYRRLQRDGWTFREHLDAGVTSRLGVFEKQLPYGWLLRKYTHAEVNYEPGHGCYWDTHEVEREPDGLRLLRNQWEWADFDGRMLAWTERGCLLRAEIGHEGVAAEQLVHDFNFMQFEARTAPY